MQSVQLVIFSLHLILHACVQTSDMIECKVLKKELNKALVVNNKPMLFFFDTSHLGTATVSAHVHTHTNLTYVYHTHIIHT
jgi:hypothetical protein